LTAGVRCEEEREERRCGCALRGERPCGKGGRQCGPRGDHGGLLERGPLQERLLQPPHMRHQDRPGRRDDAVSPLVRPLECPLVRPLECSWHGVPLSRVQSGTAGLGGGRLCGWRVRVGGAVQGSGESNPCGYATRVPARVPAVLWTVDCGLHGTAVCSASRAPRGAPTHPTQPGDLLQG
jgi:hypothetical protein